MINPNALEIRDLDFDLIKESFKSFLKNQNEFKDYNFDGSNINSLLDILSYNTYYNAFYMNMIVNESFLDSASQRSSVVSITKPIGFIPKSFKSAKIAITIIIDANLSDTTTLLVIPKFSKFSGGSLIFYNIEAIILNKIENQFISSDVVILFEGEYQTFRFIVKNYDNYFVIPFKNIDLDTLEVQVFPTLNNYESFKSVENHLRYYTKIENIYNINKDSKIFFIQENVDGFYSIHFGDNTLGKKLENDNVIETKFLKSSGQAGNKLKNFTFEETFEGDTYLGEYSSSMIQVFTINNDLESFDGDTNQDIESIRKYAPYHFEAQQRIVTIKDYEYFISNFQPDIECLRIWGGETNNPPKYGSIICMIKLYNKEKLNIYQKKILIDYIKENSIVGLDFIILDPNLIYLLIKLEFKINYNIIRNINIFKDKVNLYLKEFIGDFQGNIFRKSDLNLFLRTKDPFIKSLKIDLKIQKNLYYLINVYSDQIINFNTSIIPGSISSSLNFSLKESEQNINITEKFLDDEKGNLLYNYKNLLSDEESFELIGKIDYNIGKIIINTCQVISYFDNNKFISFFAKPLEDDIYTNQETILSLNINNIESVFLNDNF